MSNPESTNAKKVDQEKDLSELRDYEICEKYKLDYEVVYVVRNAQKKRKASSGHDHAQSSASYQGH